MSQIAFPYEPYAFGVIAAASQNIGSIVNTNGLPAVFTLTGHGYTTGQYIRIASVTGQTGLNGNWVINVLSPNTFGLISSTGVTPTAPPLGNGVGCGGGTVAATPLPITVNRPGFANQGIAVQALACQIIPGNTGNVYIGVIIPGTAFMSIAAPYLDTCFMMQKTLVSPQNIPIFSPVSANIIQIDKFFVDFDTIGDGVLITAFQR